MRIDQISVFDERSGGWGVTGENSGDPELPHQIVDFQRQRLIATAVDDAVAQKKPPAVAREAHRPRACITEHITSAPLASAQRKTRYGISNRVATRSILRAVTTERPASRLSSATPSDARTPRFTATFSECLRLDGTLSRDALRPAIT